MYDVLDVKDPIVLNVLIEQCGIETILLIEHREEANRVMNRDRPRGASSAYTPDGDQVMDSRHYSNKQGRIGIIRKSVNDVLGYVHVLVCYHVANYLHHDKNCSLISVVTTIGIELNVCGGRGMDREGKREKEREGAWL